MNRCWLLLLLILAFPVSAAEWVMLRLPGSGDQYFYDRSKLFISGDEITYWKKVIFRVPQPVKESYATSGLYRERIHCSEHTLKLISYLLYAADGATIEYVATHDSEAAPIIPDTVGDMFEKTACDLVRQKQQEQRTPPANEVKLPEKTPATTAPVSPPDNPPPPLPAPVTESPAPAVPAKQ